ncbi:DUF5671 domain-containing protein [Luteimonas sp. BDR2-5]|uniref:DUF5671 domain-containing protein n=1 Tax=Proluteimonas luteida TaxID=2878685 RepID=UPI001E5F6F97|nr:DUF5671 domain-containing protein [Luteimonas sp. BDR2-5]MCD9028821.1 DUF5671 domain-containing protein [Luteimonas sp. BDR2-5]
MASTTRDLEGFVGEALAKGADREAIAAAATGAGWPVEQVRSALDAWAEVPFVVPVPRPRPSLSARDAFLYLVMFATLYVSAWQLGSLLFDLINHTFPDPADPDYRVQRIGQSMRWAASSVVIAFPVFVFVARLLSREIARNPLKRLSPVRRWLTYMTLFLAATALVGDMIALVYNVLGGELSVRFLLKVAVAGAIAGAIFAFYLLDLRREEVEA